MIKRLALVKVVLPLATMLVVALARIIVDHADRKLESV